MATVILITVNSQVKYMSYPRSHILNEMQCECIQLAQNTISMQKSLFFLNVRIKLITLILKIDFDQV